MLINSHSLMLLNNLNLFTPSTIENSSSATDNIHNNSMVSLHIF